jgi:hypothetical protein
MLIQMLLPTKSAQRTSYSDDLLRRTRRELIDRFGGITAYTRAPASGVWTSPDGDVEEDDVVMIEVLAEQFDIRWWQSYASTLKERFQQESILIRANEVIVLEN